MLKSFETALTSEIPCEIIKGETRRDRLIELPNNILGNWPAYHAMFNEAGYWLKFYEEDGRLLTTYNHVACSNCDACKPSRIRIKDFTPTDAQAELMKTPGYNIIFPEKINSDEHKELAYLYQTTRHPGRNSEETKEYWNHKKGISRCMEIRDEKNALMAGVLFQVTNNIVVGDFYYYRPDITKTIPPFSIYMQLMLIDHIKTLPGVNYLYIGSWTREPSPYSYKARLPGLEIRENDEWKRLSSKERKKALSAYFKVFPAQKPE